MADKDFYQRQQVSLPWCVVVPLWALTLGVWVNALWTYGLTETIRDYLLR